MSVVNNLYNPALKIIGSDIKKENLAESFLENPKIIPIEIVDPDLETPGKRAKLWKKPIIKDLEIVILFKEENNIKNELQTKYE